MAWINGPVCERCWVEREGEWEPNPDDPGQVRLVSLRQPVRLINPAPDGGEFRIESCHFCGWPTFIGIYQRVEVP
jgi:hypothetical protein